MKDKIEILKGKLKQTELPDYINEESLNEVKAFHRTISEYEETPLVDLESLATDLGISNIYVKDESKRFGLNAFKGLGASYAIHKLLNEIPQSKNMAFVTATDGNHGKAVAWAASKRNIKSYVFMPLGSSKERAQAIENEGASVEITEYNYADTVKYADDFARKNGYYLIQDTAFEGYDKIPNWITQGYMTMADEAVHQILQMNGDYPTHVIIQAGVGSVAGAVTGYFAMNKEHERPEIIVVEPSNVACIYESAKNDRLTVIGGNPQTDMAGLNCGEPNLNTWPVLRDYISFYAKCPDWVTWEGMRQLANPINGDKKIISGESGAVGAGFVKTICKDPVYRTCKDELGFTESSSVLLFSTEGATDKANYRKITGADMIKTKRLNIRPATDDDYEKLSQYKTSNIL